MTLRRLQKFKVQPGKTYVWEFKQRVSGRQAQPQNGEVQVADDGLITVHGLQIPGSGGRLVVTPK